MASILTNMGIKSWDAAGDPFSYSELATNWTKIDQHDHTSGKGVQIPTAGIQNLAITAAKLATASIDSTKLVAGGINWDRLNLKAGGLVGSGGTITASGTDQIVVSTNVIPSVTTIFFVIGSLNISVANSGSAIAGTVNAKIAAVNTTLVWNNWSRAAANGTTLFVSNLTPMAMYSVANGATATFNLTASTPGLTGTATIDPTKSSLAYFTLG